MILSFKDKEARRVFKRERSKRIPPTIYEAAHLKLIILHAAHRLEDLGSPPGNRLEALKGDRIGQFSVRINDQWRVCFSWRDGNAHDVEIVDYH